MPFPILIRIRRYSFGDDSSIEQPHSNSLPRDCALWVFSFKISFSSQQRAQSFRCFVHFVMRPARLPDELTLYQELPAHTVSHIFYQHYRHCLRVAQAQPAKTAISPRFSPLRKRPKREERGHTGQPHWSGDGTCAQLRQGPLCSKQIRGRQTSAFLGIAFLGHCRTNYLQQWLKVKPFSMVLKMLFQHQLLTTGKLSSGHSRERDKWSLNK